MAGRVQDNSLGTADIRPFAGLSQRLDLLKKHP
jgi:hypothetical protein